MSQIPCAHCQTLFEPRNPDHRFCKDTCRAAWHKAVSCPGEVTSIRALKRGGWSVTIKYPTHPGGVKIGTAVRLETPDKPRTDAY